MSQPSLKVGIKKKKHNKKAREVEKPPETLCYYNPIRYHDRDKHLREDLRDSHLKAIARNEFTNQTSLKQQMRETSFKLDFMQLFEKFHIELKIDFDKDLADYFALMSNKAGGVITHMESFDENLPPFSPDKDAGYFQNQIVAQLALRELERSKKSCLRHICSTRWFCIRKRILWRYKDSSLPKSQHPSQRFKDRNNSVADSNYNKMSLPMQMSIRKIRLMGIPF
ncbi:hypothetical protein FGO68_gene6430 [Halteria grandinella]|uniref:Uncharacterized protein n=1 Tax=Halteria grandinella TaxID=5974 RepID=A0A8J8P0K1_HALGN|nr:hypothetical protein FGO68_gene6430 [Halteria grandinella]